MLVFLVKQLSDPLAGWIDHCVAFQKHDTSSEELRLFNAVGNFTQAALITGESLAEAKHAALKAGFVLPEMVIFLGV